MKLWEAALGTVILVGVGIGGLFLLSRNSSGSSGSTVTTTSGGSADYTAAINSLQAEIQALANNANSAVTSPIIPPPPINITYPSPSGSGTTNVYGVTPNYAQAAAANKVISQNPITPASLSNINSPTSQAILSRVNAYTGLS